MVKLRQKRVKWWNRDFHADCDALRKQRVLDLYDEDEYIQQGEGGVLSLEYRLTDGGIMQVHMKYVVVSVCQVMAGVVSA